QDTDSDTITTVTDLSLALDAPVNPYDPASAMALPLRATVANAGPSLAREAVVSLSFSAPVTVSLPAGCSSQGGQMVSCVVDAIAPGDAAVLDFSLRNLPAAPGTFAVLGNVVRDTDPDAGNDADRSDILLQTGGDARVGVDNGEQRLRPGATVTYTIDVTNFGSTTLTGVLVDATPATGLLDASWTCSGSNGASCSSGSGAIADSVDLASGQSVRYRLTATVDPDLDPGVPTLVSQSATATTAPGADFNLSNNTAVDEDVVFHLLFGDGFE